MQTIAKIEQYITDKRFLEAYDLSSALVKSEPRSVEGWWGLNSSGKSAPTLRRGKKRGKGDNWFSTQMACYMGRIWNNT